MINPIVLGKNVFMKVLRAKYHSVNSSSADGEQSIFLTSLLKNKQSGILE